MSTSVSHRVAIVGVCARFRAAIVILGVGVSVGVLGANAASARTEQTIGVYLNLPPDTGPDLMRSMVAQLLAERSPKSLRRLYVDVLNCGRVPWKSVNTPFAALGWSEALPEIAAACHARGVELWGVAEVLRWSEWRGDSVFARLPDLQELPHPDGSDADSSDGVFASPFNPNTRKWLVAFVGELAAQPTQLGGLVLDCRLSHSQGLGYSDVARLASIREINCDPVDLDGACGAAENQLALAAWIKLRESATASLARALTEAYRRGAPERQIGVTGFADYYEWSRMERGMVAEDWGSWAEEGIADVVLLHDAVSARPASLSFANYGIRRINQVGVPFRAIASVEAAGQSLSAKVASKVTPQEVVFRVSSLHDVEALLRNRAWGR